jgi:dihydroorotase-like cyclic amidohydrolase
MWLSVQNKTAETLLFKNATVWTNEKEGILEETDVLVKNGKISAIGKIFQTLLLL